MAEKTSAVIFDMDGVLTDSEWFIAEAGLLMFREHGVEVTHEDFKPFIGKGENTFLGGVAKKKGFAGFVIERDKARTYAIYCEIIKGKLKALPGSVDFVYRCRELSLKTALASSTDFIKVMANLQAIGLHNSELRSDQVGLAAAVGAAARYKAFDAIVNGLDVEKQKPFPDLYLEAARRIDTAPGECWVIEDSTGGVEAAKSAGMRCLALLTSFGRDELCRAGADRIATNLAEYRAEDLLTG
ncbi:MAG: HAD-IA family hydrolase [Treponema sp.]|jgi:beta-phosphoglucomutase-like phosphatase (HAD superfamily)|nr:HAD-IA family hydrolase [Treponema sp.]